MAGAAYSHEQPFVGSATHSKPQTITKQYYQDLKALADLREACCLLENPENMEGTERGVAVSRLHRLRQAALDG